MVNNPPSMLKPRRNWKLCQQSFEVTISSLCMTQFGFHKSPNQHGSYTPGSKVKFLIYTFFPSTSRMRALSRVDRIQLQRRYKLMAVSLSTSAKASNKFFLQILGTETRDTTPSLFLFADSQRCVDLMWLALQLTCLISVFSQNCVLIALLIYA